MFSSTSPKESPFKFWCISINDQDRTVSLRSTHNHIRNKVLMTWSIKNNKLSCLWLKVVLPNINCNSSFSLFFLLIEKISKLKARFSISFTEFFHFMHFLFIDSSHFEQQMTHQCTLTRINMAYDYQVQAICLLCYFNRICSACRIGYFWVNLIQNFVIN